MSIQLSTLIWNLRIKGAHTKIILLRLADHANNAGYAWPGTRSLAIHCGICRDTVRNRIRWLTELGIVEIVEKETNRRSRKYRLHIDVAQEIFGIIPKPDRRGPSHVPQEVKSRSIPETPGASATDLQRVVPPTKTVKNLNKTVTTPASNNEAPAKRFPGLPIWESKKEKMKSVVGNGWWKSWMEKAVPLDDDGATLTLAVPSQFVRGYLRNQEIVTVGRLENILQRRIEFIVDPRLKKDS